jgi:branched-chain amino acid transport system substrate-binding protein
MELTRRGFIKNTIGTGVALSGGLAMPAIASGNPVKVGWLTALTGPSSAGGIGLNMGFQFIGQQVNAKGGAGGRKLDIIVRDSQSDPTKAVNMVQEMISRQKIDVLFGPGTSGESLATTPIVARNKVPNITPAGLDQLIQPEKYPSIFRVISANLQWEEAIRNYCLDKLKVKKVAVIGDSTGYGTTAVATNVENFKKSGVEVVYQGVIDPSQPDVNPDVVRIRDAGPEVIVVWSLSPGLCARLMNARGNMNWQMPLVGHPTMGSGQVAPLLEKREYWENVFILNYNMCSMDQNGKLPDMTQAFVDQAKATIDFDKTVLWWVAAGAVAMELISAAVRETGGNSKEGYVKYWNSVKDYKTIMGSYTFSSEQHNGLATSELVMCHASSFSGGAFKLA